jgi:hypothetical protein
LLFPYEEHGLIGNLLGIALLYIGIALVYFIFKPLLSLYLEKRSKPIEPGADIPDEEYWQEELSE